MKFDRAIEVIEFSKENLRACSEDEFANIEQIINYAE